MRRNHRNLLQQNEFRFSLLPYICLLTFYSMTKHIPNTITILNLFCGCVAVIQLFEKHYDWAFFFVALGIFFDFFDGMAARIFNAASPLGLQLDSLADMVTSGVTPGLTLFFMLQNSSGMPADSVIPYLGFLPTLGSCYRLANFNIDTRQTDSFIGMPTPGNALFIVSLPVVLASTTSLIAIELLTNHFFLIVLAALSAFLLNAPIPLFSLKFKSFRLSKMKFQLVLVLFSVLSLVVLQVAAVPLIIFLYVVLSMLKNATERKSQKTSA